MIQESGNIGLFLYGMLNKLLVPLGLHHLIYTPFQFSDVGGTLALGDTVIAGAYPIRVAEMAMVGQPFSASTYFNSYTFNNLWPYLGIGTAFIVTSYKRNRDKTRAIILPLIITAILTCITEPMDFLFVFAAPVLFVVHAVLSGISLVLLKVLNIPAATAGGIINIVVSNLVLGVEKTNWPLDDRPRRHQRCPVLRGLHGAYQEAAPAHPWSRGRGGRRRAFRCDGGRRSR